jgi:multicomponent Na+:H+ antiporter subunit F
MNDFVIGIATLVLTMVAIGLVAIFQRAAETDRLMAAQLLGSGGVTVLVLLAVATHSPAIVDVALLLALFAAFVAVAFVRDARGTGDDSHEAASGR